METTNDSFEHRFQALSKELDHLKILYDQYFCGVLKTQPQQEHAKWKASFATLLQLDLKSSSQKFQRSSLQSKHLSLQNLWSKTSKQMEEGVNRRQTVKSLRSAQDLKTSPLDLNIAKSIEGIYQTIVSHYEKIAKALPSKEEFQNSVLVQIKNFREKNPYGKMEVYLKKTSQGEVRVSVRSKI